MLLDVIVKLLSNDKAILIVDDTPWLGLCQALLKVVISSVFKP